MTRKKSDSISTTGGPGRPLSRRGIPRWAVYLAATLGVVYILNPTLGVFEILPDNLPFVGNLDEGAAAVLIWYGFVEGWEQFRSRRSRETAPQGADQV